VIDRAAIIQTLNETEDDAAFLRAVGEVFSQSALMNTPTLTAVLGMAVGIAHAEGRAGRVKVLEMIQRIPDNAPIKLYVVLSVAYTYNDEYMYSHENEPGFADSIFFTEEEATQYVDEMNASELSELNVGEYTSESLFAPDEATYGGQWGHIKDRLWLIKQIGKIIGDPDWDPEDGEPDYHFTLPSLTAEELVSIRAACKETDIWFPDFYRLAHVAISE